MHHHRNRFDHEDGGLHPIKFIGRIIREAFYDKPLSDFDWYIQRKTSIRQARKARRKDLQKEFRFRRD